MPTQTGRSKLWISAKSCQNSSDDFSDTTGALVLHVSPRKLTPALINRYLHVKAQRLL